MGEPSVLQLVVLVDLLKVVEFLGGVRDDGVLTRGPVGWADDGVLVGELEGLDQPQGLVDRPADGKVVHGDLPDDALAVDDDEATERHTHVGQVHPVVLGDGVEAVRHHGDRQAANSALQRNEMCQAQ